MSTISKGVAKKMKQDVREKKNTGWEDYPGGLFRQTIFSASTELIFVGGEIH